MADQPTKRKRGGQPGNHNRLKHGRYVARKNLVVSPPSAEDQLTTIDHLIRAIKKSMSETYFSGIELTDHHEVLRTLNGLSNAAIGLCRLIHLRDGFSSLPDAFHSANFEEMLEQLRSIKSA